MKKLNGLFEQKLNVVNIGLEIFYDALLSQKASACHVEWRPPACGDADLLAILGKLNDPDMEV